MNLLADEFEVIDPNPDIWALFLEYNALFFDDLLNGCEIKWSKRMTLCAGLCSFQPMSGFCSIRLSEPLLKLRPRSDLVNTLLHEMIHAFIFLNSPVRDHEDHGPQFQFHMHRINALAQTKITVYHTFNDEVDSYRVHWWKCNGPCQHSPPYFGLVKRSMNRPPSARDPWWGAHQSKCGGTYTKIKEPDNYKKKKQNKPAPDTAQTTMGSFFKPELGDVKPPVVPTKRARPSTPPAPKQPTSAVLAGFFDPVPTKKLRAEATVDTIDLTLSD
ncbi:hypothetical protein SPRG_13784 [Saprolegnia parasitica CBS 223.65]|uniref:SprT-like domain-containing protein n=1 Tax=Saprolegnia parasitica (strain CBS 223.65) TaxID=695850 RepID=A0A067C2Q2_SAPPC|nr:hypothetical protein SPRG_13784 [Saprolegnia parasitica CBS 223.65]KDO21077.1 hypothetical protein SPRG_13784 [Saprolegnia parasitica CBS 223.65]|eukprot:XP_012208175.1 hypothetical protein SPRG_13784 [Saprolegnia parasitica CBS 223.65]